MLALYRSGRQAEALQAFAAARRALADELGIDPGRWLRQLETGILRQDPGLDWTPPPAEPGPPPGETGAAGPVPTASVTQRPQAAADELVGRDDQLAALEGVLAGARGGRGRVVLVAGEPGIGKTRLAEEAARRAAAAGMQRGLGALPRRGRRAGVVALGAGGAPAGRRPRVPGSSPPCWGHRPPGSAR